MGVVKITAFLAAVTAIALLVLSLNTAFLQQPREEITAGEQLTGMLPSDRIQKEQVVVYPDRAIIEVRGLKWANISATNSMLPVLGTGSHAIQVVPRNAYEVSVGDIVSYTLDNKIIIHRVIEIGNDESGIFFITKGDNNPMPDPEPVRFSQIDRVVVGILY